ncbi:MAG: hypothetical protein COX79_03375 [Candidatus Levybacteria bacterium CG_4_10_14_0_2_um_filter_36_16]|nr:MAG: hypothetical protein AUK12_01750 [Candidatus Levybacteria bacterium CG2_30_37_29]PIR79208.1 MAG: hypothetical protein COU26_02385 [Candidatus Levybacteria bacterium CG10_big_fil_rev_8_21_14_0_10_36_30]PIZ97082.1 MAG: hypothetical protein COX79_03375 [Candidatus Levybacteria bacterium CG_4_10_14_0_2_um_filter_36_16]
MKRIFLVYALLIVAILAFAAMRGGSFLPTSLFKTTPTATINGKIFNLSVARSDKDRIKGLSGKDSLEQNTGMLFVFNKKDYYSFWMKDMKFPIDIIFIDDSTVVDLFENTLPPQNINSELSVYKPKSPGNYVLEVNGGTASKNNLKIGDKIELKGIK